MAGVETSFFVTGGTLRHDAPSYVERQADKEIFKRLQSGEFCFVLTSRQMGKSSLMVRTASKLRADSVQVAVVDLTSIGQNLTIDQWYHGLLLRIDRQLSLNDALDDYWMAESRSSPLQRFISGIHDVALPKCKGQLVVFIDEIDVVRSLPFVTDEFFAAIRECYNRRAQAPEFNRLTFCLLGAATPSELIRDPRTTPFNVGDRIDLADFDSAEARPFAAQLHPDPAKAEASLNRVLHWTGGHPYLTQQLCRAIKEEASRSAAGASSESPEAEVDRICERLFLSLRARSQDDNLMFVRERILRTEGDLSELLSLYEEVLSGADILDDDANELQGKLRLAGIVRVTEGRLRVRNRVYERVFDPAWIADSRPNAVLEIVGGERFRLQGSCSIGRATTNDIPLVDGKVSRRHAMIQAHRGDEFWLMDLGSSNGSFINGKRVLQPAALRNGDKIEIGPFVLTFQQTRLGVQK